MLAPAGRRAPMATAAVLVVAVITVVGLLVLAPAYGFHRDELYFIIAGRHPDWGYVDQPPLTPLLSAAAVALLGVEPWAARILPALAMGAVIVLTALIAREMGGSARAQIIAAVVLATSGYLASGHLGSTVMYDALAWATILWLITRLLRGSDPRAWLAVGVVGGIGLQNKHLVLFLAAGILVGLLVHRRDMLRSRWPWLGALLALLIWSPNLAWQLANGLPQLEMARKIGGEADENRVMLLPELLLVAGPLLFPVSIAGLWRLLRSAELRALRALGTAFLAIVVLVFLSGGKSYYAAGALPPLMAAGAIAVDRWLGASRARLSGLGAATIGSLAIVSLLVLPVLPADVLATTPILELYDDSGETVGWPELVDAVEEVVASLPAETRERAVILTTNYGEAGALELLGEDLPPVYSGHNSVWSWGPPPDELDAIVLVSVLPSSQWPIELGRCEVAARIGNAAGMPNEESRATVQVCDRVPRPLSEVWADVRHFD